MGAMKKTTDNPEENTQSPDLTHSQMYRKQLTDSPWLWVQLVGGSLIFHGALLAIALPLTARLSAASQSSSPAPVEFVELFEPPPQPEITSQPPVESAVPAAPAATEPIAPQPTFNEMIPSNDLSFAPEPSPEISPLSLPSPEVLPSPELSPQPSPEVLPSPEARSETPLETAALPPQPDSLPLPVLPSVSPDTPLPQPTPTQPEISPSDPGLQTTRITTPVPDVSESIAAAPSTVDSDNLDSANSEAVAPVGVTLSLSSVSQVAPPEVESADTLEVARPTLNRTSFLPDPSVSPCQVTPAVLNRAGTPIALQVATDEQGKAIEVSVYQSSGSPDYDQLAVCLVKEQWRFEPATVLNPGETQRQAIANDELLITIVIDRN